MAARLFWGNQYSMPHVLRVVGFSTGIIGSLKTEPQLAASPAKTALSSLGKLCASLSADREPISTANRFTANRFTANRFTANRFTANRFTANRFTANIASFADREAKWGRIFVRNSRSIDGNGQSSGNAEIPPLNR